jgi:hypothetical protein
LLVVVLSYRRLIFDSRVTVQTYVGMIGFLDTHYLIVFVSQAIPHVVSMDKNIGE